MLLVGCPADPALPDDASTGAATTGSAGEGTEPTGGVVSATATGSSGGDEATGTGAASSSETGATEPVVTTDAETTSPGTTGAAGSSGETTGTADTGTAGESTGGTDTGGDSSTGECALGPSAEMTAMALAAAVDGVDYPSESDYPWIVETFACAAPVSEENVKQIIAPVYVEHPGQATLADRAIEVRTLAQLFDPLTVPKDWWTDYEYERADKYKAIRAVLEDDLTDLVVFRLGEKSGDMLSGAIDVYVFGTTAEGDLVAMWTVSVET
ncbi:MAG: hypothetical protein JNL82_15825 [Myxococcales bacterium]|nr:hypothetical protein [Myxococcales bacterium]